MAPQLPGLASWTKGFPWRSGGSRDRGRHDALQGGAAARGGGAERGSGAGNLGCPRVARTERRRGPPLMATLQAHDPPMISINPVHACMDAASKRD
jgi:hypothetical protein